MDQYFTPPELAQECLNILLEFVDENSIFLEPSSGQNVFYDLLPKKRRIGYELDPELVDGDIIQGNFLKVDKLDVPEDVPIVAIGNPPFTDGTGKQRGRKRDMGRLFVKKCFELGCNYVGFLLGASYGRINKIIPGCTLLSSTYFPDIEFGSDNPHTKTHSVYFNVYELGEDIERPTLKTIEKPIAWNLVSPHDIQSKVTLCAIRWSRNNIIFNCEYDEKQVKRIRKECQEKVSGNGGTAITLCKYFFINVTDYSQWDEFCTFVKEYVMTIGTCTVTSLSTLELYMLWNKFQKLE